MKPEKHGYRLIAAVVLLVLAGAISTYAQDGKLHHSRHAQTDISLRG